MEESGNIRVKPLLTEKKWQMLNGQQQLLIRNN
jgi:hypothetical protein